MPTFTTRAPNSVKDVPPPPGSVAKSTMSTVSTRSRRVHIPSNNVRGPRGLIAAYKKQQSDDAARIVLAKRSASIRTFFVYLALFVGILAIAACYMGVVPMRHGPNPPPMYPEEGFAPSPPPSMGIVPANWRYSASNGPITPPPPASIGMSRGMGMGMDIVPVIRRSPAQNGPTTPPPPPPPPQALLELADI